MQFVVGDYVTRKSYAHDLLFRITQVNGKVALLHGKDVRLLADAPLNDLVKVAESDLKKRKQYAEEKAEQSLRLFRKYDMNLIHSLRSSRKTVDPTDVLRFHVPVKVLHLDSDDRYLNKCLRLYKRLHIDTVGLHIKEEQMPCEVSRLIKEHRPNCVVMTGHDAFSKKSGDRFDVESYRHSKHFIEAVKKARQTVPNLDDLIIFSGACQSHFELLIRAGANFASSPSRVNIHALDPVFMIASAAYTSFMDKVDIVEAVRQSLAGEKGMGGIETRGLQRSGMPYVPPEL